MRSLRPKWRQTLGGAMLSLALVASAAAAATEYEKHADGLVVYMGVMPAEVLRGRSDTDHLATMHGGLPWGSGSHHIIMSVFDEATRRQLDDATVEASVGQLGRGETRRQLEPMKIANTTTYGNFFPMAGSGPFLVRVSIRRAGQDHPTQVQFKYAHLR